MKDFDTAYQDPSGRRKVRVMDVVMNEAVVLFGVKKDFATLQIPPTRRET
jgi:hypothetical protein